MLLRDFDYFLPPELIAQTPAQPRDASRLMRVRRENGALSHHVFGELPQLLRSDDLLVFNDTRVLRARLHGRKIRADGSCGAHLEALLLRQVEGEIWECLLRPSSRLRVGTSLLFTSQDEQNAARVLAHAEILERLESSWLVRFTRYEHENAREIGGDLRAHLPQLGEVPLPPYITAPLQNEAQYQTVFARETASQEARRNALESAAAPTAGLHFTPRVLQEIEARGIRTATVTLQIGVGTFRPIKTETLDAHQMHEEHFEISEETAALINAQKKRGARVVAVGTTTTRVLEAAAQRDDAFFEDEKTLRAGCDSTSIFIKPGHTFRAVDALVTNFHLPKSSLLVMISAFAEAASTRERLKEKANSLAGIERIRYAYEQAIAARYRFFSFGDAMLID
jgi:S-adenosylmethionine:tRNA ribosyltransferase-isomerase